MNDLLVYVLYPLTVAGVLSIFGIIYKLFSTLVERMIHHEITASLHHQRIQALEQIRHRN